jgi:hypothetical protein
MAQRPLVLYRLTWSHCTGVYWLAMRACADDCAEAWLDLFRQDEPIATFCLARKPPAIQPDDRAKARHVASFR